MCKDRREIAAVFSKREAHLRLPFFKRWSVCFCRNAFEHGSELIEFSL